MKLSDENVIEVDFVDVTDSENDEATPAVSLIVADAGEILITAAELRKLLELCDPDGETE